MPTSGPDLFNRLSPEEQEALLPALSQAEREAIRRIAAHREGSGTDRGALPGKELLVAGALGLTMALAVSLLGVFRAGPDIALVVALSIW